MYNPTKPADQASTVWHAQNTALGVAGVQQNVETRHTSATPFEDSGRATFPTTPASQLILHADNGIARLEVTPDSTLSIERVQMMYSIDPDPQARFWRTAEATSANNTWSAPLPIMTTDQPLFAIANVHYRLDKPEPVQFAQPTSTFALSSLLHTATPDEPRRQTSCVMRR